MTDAWNIFLYTLQEHVSFFYPVNEIMCISLHTYTYIYLKRQKYIKDIYIG